MSSSRMLEPLDKKQQQQKQSTHGGSDIKSCSEFGEHQTNTNTTRDHDPSQLFPKCKPRLILKSPTDQSQSPPITTTRDWNANSNGSGPKHRSARSIRNELKSSTRIVNPGSAVRSSRGSGYDNNNGSSTSASSSSASSRLSLASPLPGNKDRKLTSGFDPKPISGNYRNPHKGGAGASAQETKTKGEVKVGGKGGMEVDSLNLDPDSGIGGGTGSGTGSSENGTGSGSGSSGTGQSDVSLRDSRIEIAGGREIFSQSRSRVSRRLQGQQMTKRTTPLPSTSSSNSSNSVWEKNRSYPRVPSLTTMTTGTGTDGSNSNRHMYAYSGQDHRQSQGGHSGHGHSHSHGHHHHGRNHRGKDNNHTSQSQHYTNPRFDYAAQARSFERGLRFPQSEDLDPEPNSPISPSGHHHLLPKVHGAVAGPPISLTIKETVFGSEITSIEKSVVGVDVVPLRPSGGEIVFDDIEDNEETWREEESFPKVTVASSCGYDEFDDNLSEDSSSPKHKIDEDNSQLIGLGLVPIADYEGSPKRYGLKSGPGININFDETVTSEPSPPNNVPTTSFHSSGIGTGTSARLPGFPQRVNKSTPMKMETGEEPHIPHHMGNGTSTSLMVVDSGLMAGSITPESVIGQLNVKMTRDTSPDDSVASQHGSQTSNRSSACTSSSEAELSPPAGISAEAAAAAAAALRVEDLYEFSETRKVLEDFFKAPPGSRNSTLGGLTPETRSLLGLGHEGTSSFSDLDYTLKRQAGNSYIGSRLAGDLNIAELSPRKPPRRGGREVVMSMSLAVGGEGPEGNSGGEGGSPRLISFHEVSRRPSSMSPGSQSSHQGDLSRDVNDNDIDVETTSTNTETDLGDTEVGLQVGHSRNFTLSPETTDCDSNELESEMSLDYDASLHSSSRVGATMPVLEDGLSSGNASESEEGLLDPIGQVAKKGSSTAGSSHSSNKILPSIVTTTNATNSSPESSVNPTLLLMKKQITEIEKEIKMRASQQQQQNQQQSQLNGGFGLSSSHLPPVQMQIQIQQPPCCDNTGQFVAGSSAIVIASGSLTSKRSGPGTRGQEAHLESHFDSTDPELEALDPMRPTPPPSPAPASSHHQQPSSSTQHCNNTPATNGTNNGNSNAVAAAALQDIKEAILKTKQQQLQKPRYDTSPTSPTMVTGGKVERDRNSSSNTTLGCSTSNSSHRQQQQTTSSLQQQQQHQNQNNDGQHGVHTISSSDERLSVQQQAGDSSPVWVPRRLSLSGSSHLVQDSHHRLTSDMNASVRDPLLRKSTRYEETPDDDADTDQETDRLLGQNRADDDYGFYDDKQERKRLLRSRSLLPRRGMVSALIKSVGVGVTQPPLSSMPSLPPTNLPSTSTSTKISTPPTPSGTLNDNTSSNSSPTDNALQLNPDEPFYHSNSTNSTSSSTKTKKEKDGVKKKRSKEDFLKTPSVLIEGVLFRARYLGSTQLVCEGQPTKATRMLQAEEAVSRIKQQASIPLTGREDSAVIIDNTTLSSSTVTVTVPSYVPRPPAVSSASIVVASERKISSSEDYDEYLYAVGPEENESEEEDEDGQSSERSQLTVTSAPFEKVNEKDLEVAAERQQQQPTRRLGSPYGSAIPGTMFRLRFFGSLEVEEEIGFGKRRRRRPKKTMVEEAVMKVKAPEGETQPSTEVDLFISTEKIMVLNTDLKEIMMDHALRTISYIADIGDLVVLMARRRPIQTDDTPEEPNKILRPPKMICHVFESDEAQYIAQSIGQAFQVAYMEFLKANGIEDQSFVREMDYQEVLNSQEIFGDELQMFAKKELQKEVVVPKTKGEILGVVIVESGWGSMLPTVVIANLAPAGAAARCGQLNIGDQIIAINGVSLVGLPLSTCQTYIKNTKPQTVVKLTIVPCPPVVEVKIKRPDTKYQLGFSVQNGVICSLLRGGIAERGGVRVGHRIIEINNQSVVAVPHEKIVNLLATSVGEINMKTMPTSMFRLLTGQETPLYI